VNTNIGLGYQFWSHQQKKCAYKLWDLVSWLKEWVKWIIQDRTLGMFHCGKEEEAKEKLRSLNIFKWLWREKGGGGNNENLREREYFRAKALSLLWSKAEAQELILNRKISFILIRVQLLLRQFVGKKLDYFHFLLEVMCKITWQVRV
jgi:hypothetical protein